MKARDLLLPEPRSYVGTAVTMGMITGVPFGILMWAAMALMESKSFGELLPYGLAAGWLFGISSGLTMALLFKGQTSTVTVGDPNSFVARLNVAMSQLGYNPVTRTEDFLTFKPSFQAGLAAGRVSVQLMPDQAVIVGPKMYVNKLTSRLSTQS